jgi:hypothetical protein
LSTSGRAVLYILPPTHIYRMLPSSSRPSSLPISSRHACPGNTPLFRPQERTSILLPHRHMKRRSEFQRVDYSAYRQDRINDVSRVSSAVRFQSTFGALILLRYLSLMLVFCSSYPRCKRYHTLDTICLRLRRSLSERHYLLDRDSYVSFPSRITDWDRNRAER